MHRALLPAVLSLSVLLSALATAHAASYTFTTIDYPSALYTSPTEINETGQIVGQFLDRTEGTGGFPKDGATFTSIDCPDTTATFSPLGINDAGQIVGGFYDATGMHAHGCVTDGTTATTICRGARTSSVLPENSANFCARLVRMTRGKNLRTTASCLRTSWPT
jgi:hypothetical protein